MLGKNAVKSILYICLFPLCQQAFWAYDLPFTPENTLSGTSIVYNIFFTLDWISFNISSGFSISLGFAVSSMYGSIKEHTYFDWKNGCLIYLDNVLVIFLNEVETTCSLYISIG